MSKASLIEIGVRTRQYKTRFDELFDSIKKCAMVYRYQSSPLNIPKCYDTADIIPILKPVEHVGLGC